MKKIKIIGIHSPNKYLVNALVSLLTPDHHIDIIDHVPSPALCNNNYDVVISDIYNAYIEPDKINIIISFHKMTCEVVEVLPNVYVVRKESTTNIFEKIIMNKSDLIRREHQRILSINDVCLLRSFTNGMSIHTLAMITGHTTKQIYAERKKIMNRFQLSKTLLHLMAPVIIENFRLNDAIDFPYCLNRDRSLISENSYQ